MGEQGSNDMPWNLLRIAKFAVRNGNSLHKGQLYSGRSCVRAGVSPSQRR